MDYDPIGNRNRWEQKVLQSLHNFLHFYVKLIAHIQQQHQWYIGQEVGRRLPRGPRIRLGTFSLASLGLYK